MDLPKQALHRLLFSMMRIRKVQLHIADRYLEDEMQTPVHLCVGQEAVAVGVCAQLRRDDCINSNHRGHGHYLAKGGDLKALIAELYGRESGCSKGRGGSMHLVDTSVGHLGSSSIVGGGIPLGTGIGLAIKMQKKKLVSVVFLGDGAADEGVLYESINFAVLHKLPVIFILENNQYSVCSPVAARQASESVFHSMPKSLLMSRIIDGNSVTAVYEAAKIAFRRARRGTGPSFLECRTYRMLGHAGCASQDVPGYRSQKEVDYWQERCPVRSFTEKLRVCGLITQPEIDTMGTEIDSEIRSAFVSAREAHLPKPADLARYLYKD